MKAKKMDFFTQKYSPFPTFIRKKKKEVKTINQ